MAGHPLVPRLMLVTNRRRSRLPLLELAERAVAGGVDGIYLRDLVDEGAMAARAGDAGIAPTRELRTRVGDEVAVVVNGGVERAAALRAGLHLRERDPSPADARRRLGAAALIGRSVHSPEAAAASAGVDYLLAGHVYPSASKPGRPPLGLEHFAAIVAAAPCPVLAIGGITAERVPEVVRAGAHGIAVIGAIAGADDPRAAATALRAALDRALRDGQEKSPMAEKHTASTGATTIEIVVNGKSVSVPERATIHDFLASKRMTGAMAIVERNGEIVPRADYATTPLAAGDRLEVVHAVGGG